MFLYWCVPQHSSPSLLLAAEASYGSNSFWRQFSLYLCMYEPPDQNDRKKKEYFDGNSLYYNKIKATTHLFLPFVFEATIPLLPIGLRSLGGSCTEHACTASFNCKSAFLCRFGSIREA